MKPNYEKAIVAIFVGKERCHIGSVMVPVALANTIVQNPEDRTIANLFNKWRKQAGVGADYSQFIDWLDANEKDFEHPPLMVTFQDIDEFGLAVADRCLTGKRKTNTHRLGEEHVAATDSCRF